MTVAVPPQGLRRQEDISQAERAALSDAELYCERRCLAVMLDLFEVRLPSYRLPPWAASSPTSARCHPSNLTSPRQAYYSSLLLFPGQRLAPR